MISVAGDVGAGLALLLLRLLLLLSVMLSGADAQGDA